MSRFSRFEIDFTLHIRIRSERPDGTFQYSTKLLRSDYLYSLHDDLHSADISNSDIAQAEDFMNGADVTIDNCQEKLIRFGANRYDMLLPIFSTAAPSKQQWTKYIEFVFDARHHFWSSTIPHWDFHHAVITRTNRVNRADFAHRPIFGGEEHERERLYSSEHYSCIPRFLLYGCKGTPHHRWAISVAKKYGVNPMTFHELQTELNEYPSVSVYIFDLFGSLAFKHKASALGTVTAIVGKLVTDSQNRLHVETVDDAAIIKSVCQKDDTRVEANDYFGLFKFKVEQASAVHRVIDDIDDWTDEMMEPHNKLTIYYMDSTKKGCDIADVVRELQYSYPHDPITKTHLNHKGHVVTVVHPKCDNTVYMLGDKYRERRDFYDRVKDVYPRFLSFQNQSPNSIADDIHACLYGGLTTNALYSNLRGDIRTLLLSNNITELCVCVADKDDLRLPEATQYDMVRCFSDVLYNAQEDWNQMSIFAELQPYSGGGIFPGEYFIYLNQITLSNPLLRIPGGMYPHSFVKYLLRRKYITKANITWYLPACNVFKHDHFKPIIDFVYANTDDNSYIRKECINRMIGCFRRTNTKTYKSCMTGNEDYACYLKTQANEAGLFCSMYHEQVQKPDIVVDDRLVEQTQTLYTIKKHQKHVLYKTGLPIHRQIIAGSIQKLDEMYIFFSRPESVLLRVVTDSICLTNDQPYFEEDTPKLFVRGAKRIEDLGKYQLERITATKFHQREIDFRKIDDHLRVNLEALNNSKPRVVQIVTENPGTYESLVTNKGGIVLGLPGCGKSWLALQLAHDQRFKRVLFLALTNSCVNLFRNKCTRTDVKCSTLDMFFQTETETQAWVKLGSYDCILLDEFCMMSLIHVEALYKIYQHRPLTEVPAIYCFGDSNQCRILIGPHQYEYEQTTCVQQLTRHLIVEMQFKEQYCRYDRSTYDILKEFSLTRTLKREWFQPLDMNHLPRMNICYTNVSVNQINTKLIKTHGFKADTPMVATEKKRIGDKKTVYTNEFYKYSDFPPEVMASSTFKVGHACTTHCIQGSTIEGPYGLHQLNLPITRFNHVYTMMSRCKSISQVHAFIGTIDENRVYALEHAVNQPCVIVDISKQTSKMYTYEILNDEGFVIYIGITEVDNPYDRWKQHIDRKTRNRDLTAIDSYLVQGTNAFKCKFNVTGTYNLVSRSELELLESLLINRHIRDNPQHLLFNIDKVIPRLGKRRVQEISTVEDDEVDSDGESACSVGSLSLSISGDNTVFSDLTEESNDDKPVVKRVRTSMFNGAYGLPRYTDMKLIPNDTYSFVIKVHHFTDKRGQPKTTCKILAKCMNRLMANGHVKENTKNFYPERGIQSFEEAFEYMRTTYTPFELYGDYW